MAPPPRRNGRLTVLGGALLRTAARTLQRAADSLADPAPSQQPTVPDEIDTGAPPAVWRAPTGPPEHWLRLVAEHAPGLLRDMPTEARDPLPTVQPALHSPAAIRPAPARNEPLPGARISTGAAAWSRTREERQEEREPVAFPRARVSRGLFSRVRAALRPRPDSDHGWAPAAVPTSTEPDRVPAVRPHHPEPTQASWVRPEWTQPERTPQSQDEPWREEARRTVADPWPQLPAARPAIVATPALPPARQQSHAPMTAAPARMSHADFGTPHRPAVRPHSTAWGEAQPPASPWPELPDDAEVWRIPEAPFAADRPERLAREQAGR